MARESGISDGEEPRRSERITAIRVLAKETKGRRPSVLPGDAPIAAADITKVDDINSIEQLEIFVEQHPEIVLQMIQHLRVQSDQNIQLGTELDFLTTVLDRQTANLEKQADVIDKLNGKVQHLNETRQRLVNEIAEARLDSRESTPGTEGGGKRNRIKWPDAQKLKGDGDPSFPMWVQQVLTKVNKDFPEDSERVDYAISRTSGRVAAYLEPRIAVGMAPFANLDEVLQYLSDFLDDPDPRATARHKLRGMKQKNDQRITEFLGDWLAQIQRLSLDEESKIEKLVDVLCNPLRTKWDSVIDKPENLMECIRILTKLDNNMRATWTWNEGDRKEPKKPATSRYQTAGQRTAAAARTATGSTSPAPYNTDRVSGEKQIKLMKEGKCFKCEEVGHMAKDCPHTKKGGKFEKKVTEVKLNRAAVEELSSSSDSDSGKD